MKIAKVQVSGTKSVRICKQHPITAGMVGATVSFSFSPEWEGLNKTAVFQRPSDELTRDVLSIGETVTIPAEVVAEAGGKLLVGVYGVNAEGTLVIPTLWADLGHVRYAAEPSGDESTDPALPVWAQLDERVAALEEQEKEEQQAEDLAAIAALIEADMLPAVHDASGAILTDENGNIILRY